MSVSPTASCDSSEGVQAVLATHTPNIVVCFHVLQYLASPFEHLARRMSFQPPLIVLNEFPIGDRERFMVQHLLPQLGGGRRYVSPAKRRLHGPLGNYDLIEEIALPP